MDSEEIPVTKLALQFLAKNETPGSLYNTTCPCGCGGRIGVETTLPKKNRDGRGWVIRYLKCKTCGYVPPNGTNKWVTADG